ncbi:hypothetical protein BH10ACI1_BH10ACI1_07970 [soil metagenome]
MDEKLIKIFNACNPNLAAEENFYTDCKIARGGEVLAQKVKKNLQLLKSDFLRFLFTGHIGSGKSSELLHLESILKQETNFLPVYVDIEKYIDFENANLDDIFLAIAVEIADLIQSELKIQLKNSYFEEKFAEIKDIFLTKRKVSDIEVDIFGLGKAKIQEIKKNDEAKRQLYEAINKDTKSLLEELNLFIKEATLKLLQKNTPYTKLVIIVDSLEKIKKLGEKTDELASQKELFIGNQTKLRGIEAHIIYTVPLSLYRSDSGPTLMHYYNECFVLPMVKVSHRGDINKPFQEGCKAFIEILTKRLSEIPLNEAFDKDALALLIKYSGGNLRNLMRFIQEAIMSLDSLPITYKVARKSTQPTVRIYAAAIKESYYPKLVELDADSNQQIDTEDPDFWTMLENLTVMEYSNGDDTDRLDDSWYAVNPIVYEVGKFQTAQENFKKTKRKK